MNLSKEQHQLLCKSGKKCDGHPVLASISSRKEIHGPFLCYWQQQLLRQVLLADIPVVQMRVCGNCYCLNQIIFILSFQAEYCSSHTFPLTLTHVHSPQYKHFYCDLHSWWDICQNISQIIFILSFQAEYCSSHMFPFALTHVHSPQYKHFYCDLHSWWDICQNISQIIFILSFQAEYCSSHTLPFALTHVHSPHYKHFYSDLHSWWEICNRRHHKNMKLIYLRQNSWIFQLT
jgi:hypothetical protein